MTLQTYFRLRQEDGGMTNDPRKRLKELEVESQHLRREGSDLALYKLIQIKAARGAAGPRWRNLSDLPAATTSSTKYRGPLAFMCTGPVIPLGHLRTTQRKELSDRRDREIVVNLGC